jgi:phospholipid/cholesterol/gamma-HCH transport system substrate-binding protein
MPDRIKNLLIGIFVTTATGIVIFMLLFLHPYIGDEGQTLRVLFTDIDKVNVGTRVLFAGKPVGEVVEILEVEDAVIHRNAVNDDVYPYELVLKIDSSVKVYNTDKILLRTAGLLGERSVFIDPEPLKPGQILNLVGKDEVIYSAQVGTVEDAFQEIKEVSTRLSSLLDKANEGLEILKTEKSWENFAQIIKNGREISDRLAASWDDVDKSIKSIASASDNIDVISADVREGRGTLGKIVSRDDLYLRMTSLLSKGETVFDDVNHYGILFHLDKGWQRLRARRLNLLDKLSTPQEFRNYFNDEVNEIQTSLARVSMIVEKSSNFPDNCYMIENKEFTKVFAELMRRVTALEEELRMYNIQLNECEVYKTELIPPNAYYWE